MSKRAPLQPRCLDRDDAAQYLGCSTKQVDRFIHAGALPTVRYPVERSGNGTRMGVNRRILIDVKDLDRLVDHAKVRDDP